MVYLKSQPCKLTSAFISFIAFPYLTYSVFLYLYIIFLVFYYYEYFQPPFLLSMTDIGAINKIGILY